MKKILGPNADIVLSPPPPLNVYTNKIHDVMDSRLKSSWAVHEFGKKRKTILVVLRVSGTGERGCYYSWCH